MKDLNKIDIEEKASDNQDNSEKEIDETTTANQSGTLTEGIADSKETKPVRKKGSKTEGKVAVVKSPKKEKPETEPMVQKAVIVDLKEKPEPDKKQKQKIKVVIKSAKKAEEKVDKLKKKVKKAKKNEVKKSKLKDLKIKLKKAFDRLKIKIKKLKKANK